MDQPAPPTPARRTVAENFITEVIDGDLHAGRVAEVVTRFPPEPNGYLHIGHAKAIMISLGIAADYGGRAHLRFDDTNPTTEDPAFVEAMKRDIAWLGFDWDELFHTSDYFEQLYRMAVRLIEGGKAYVDSLNEEEIRRYRGTVNEPGRNSPFRGRSVEENLALFEGMRAGKYREGEHVLRAKIDMAAPNMVMRDPLLYRILHTPHYRTGDAWPIYPLYDYAHPLSDAIEGISHSLCSLEFENNREIYDWLVEALFDAPRPHQYEFSRLYLEHTVLSKRKLIELVEGGYVRGWDDPRLPTIAGLRRRGVTAEAIRALVNMVGVTKVNSTTDMGRFEYAIRDDLNAEAPRVMAVIDPLRVVLTNVDAGHAESVDAPLWPHDVPREGSRPLPFSRELWIERSDFALEPPKGWRRLSPGATVRLRHAYAVTCDEAIANDDGEVTELRCRIHPDSLGANPEGVRVAGVIHWLSARHALAAEFRLYDRLFTAPVPGAERPYLDDLNPDSLLQRRGWVEPSVQHDPRDTRYQFERLGYFWRDPVDATLEEPVFNRIVTLKDGWTKRAETATVAVSDTPARPEAPDAAPGDAGEELDPVEALTAEQRSRFERIEGRGVERSDAARIAASDTLSTLFDDALAHHDRPESVAKWLVNELQRVLKGGGPDDLPFDATAFARLVALADGDTLSTRAAKEVFEAMLDGEGAPDEIVAALGLEQVSDRDALAPILARLLAENSDKVAAYRGGKRGLLGFFVGQVMRATGGAANPQLVRELVEGALDRDA